ncbi:MAG: toll/interleukin-1 receptor domain-containing protein [Planctomycetes bacterium]|nr:toll/interleukin-1 receptor domain-containing protein [Planctomycetota bacterium]
MKQGARRRTGGRQQVFISYRREGGAELARLVRNSLVQRGYRVFMDVEDLRTGPFNKALAECIRFCTDVVIILTPGSLDRCFNQGDWVRLEIAYALQQKKNIIPVMARGFEWPPKPLPKDIGGLPLFNALTPAHEIFDASMDKLASLLHARPRKMAPKLLLCGAAIAAVVAVTLFMVLPSSDRAKQSPVEQTLKDKKPTKDKEAGTPRDAAKDLGRKRQQPPLPPLSRMGGRERPFCETLSGEEALVDVPETVEGDSVCAAWRIHCGGETNRRDGRVVLHGR